MKLGIFLEFATGTYHPSI